MLVVDIVWFFELDILWEVVIIVCVMLCGILDVDVFDCGVVDSFGWVCVVL